MSKKFSILIVISLIINYVRGHVSIAGPAKLREIFKAKTGRDEIYSNFANYGRIAYGAHTVINTTNFFNN